MLEDVYSLCRNTRNARLALPRTGIWADALHHKGKEDGKVPQHAGSNINIPALSLYPAIGEYQHHVFSSPTEELCHQAQCSGSLGKALPWLACD